MVVAALATVGCFGLAGQALAYNTEGLLVSTDLLVGEGGARRMSSFSYNASSIPSGTALKISFSQQYNGSVSDSAWWFNSAGTRHGWDTLAEGSHMIDLTALHWSGSSFYYRVWFTSDGVDTPLLDSIEITFDALVGQYDIYNTTGTLVSINLLTGETVHSIDSFTYNVSVIPAGTSLNAQFSQDNATWYSSAGVQNGTDALSTGSNTVDLSALGWSGANFYYRINYMSDGDATPKLDSISVNFTEIVVEGTVYSNEGSTPLASQQVRLAINGTDNIATTSGADGTYSFSLAASSISATDVLTIYLEDEIADAVTVTVSDGGDLAGADLYQNRLIARQDNAGSLTNGNLTTAAVSGENDISGIYSVSTGALTVVDGKELLVWTGDTFAPGGTVTADDIDINGTFTMGANTVTVSGSWDAAGGSFTSSGTVIFDSNNAEAVISNGSSFNNLTLNGAGGYWNVQDAIDVDGTLTVTAGTLDMAGSNLTATGAFTVASGSGLQLQGGETVTTPTLQSGSIVTYVGASSPVIVKDWSYKSLAFNAPGKQFNWTAGTTYTVAENFNAHGSQNDLVVFRSTVTDTTWGINDTGASNNVRYVDVKDSVATVGITDNGGVNSGNNTRWTFGSAAGVKIFKGGMRFMGGMTIK